MRLQRIALIGVPLVLLGVAVAQDEIVWNPVAWGSNPVVAAIALAGLTTWIRRTSAERGRPIDNNLAIAALALIAGAVGGMILDWLTLITVPPYATMPTPWAGVAYGVSLAVFNVTGIAIWNYLMKQGAPVSVSAPVVIAAESVPLASSAALTSTGNPAVDFIVTSARSAVGAMRLPAALVALAPLLAELAQSDAILTPDLQGELQGRMLKLLRAAGLVGVDL